jgi:hypothetical protein
VRKRAPGASSGRFYRRVPGKRFEKRREILVKGKRNIYVLSPVTQTQIREKSNGRLVAHGYLQLSVHAPCCDRLVAENLI